MNKTHSEDFLLSLQRPIAVVGNSVFEKASGEKIDSFSNIIRFNNFKIAGYELLVGKKTTVWCLNCFTDVPMRKKLSIPYFTPLSKIRPLEREDINIWTNKHKAYDLICCQNSWIRKFEKQYYLRPTLGVLILYMLTELHISATVFGFDCFATGHYWNPAKKADPTHQLDKEIDIMKRLIKQLENNNETSKTKVEG